MSNEIKIVTIGLPIEQITETINICKGTRLSLVPILSKIEDMPSMEETIRERGAQGLKERNEKLDQLEERKSRIIADSLKKSKN